MGASSGESAATPKDKGTERSSATSKRVSVGRSAAKNGSSEGATRRVGRPRGRDGNESREAILAAALRVAAADGVERLTVAAVAKEAATSPTSVFHHFGTREQLLQTMIERAILGYLENIDRSDAPIGERAARTVEAFFREDDLDRIRVVNQTLSQAIYDPAVRGWADRFWSERLGEVQDALGMPGEAGQRKAAALVACVQGATLHWLTSGESKGDRFEAAALEGVLAILRDGSSGSS